MILLNYILNYVTSLVLQKKYNKITSLAKTLQEDPSCQLLTVLRLYIKRIGIDAIEENIHVDTIPQLITIQKVSVLRLVHMRHITTAVNGSFITTKSVPNYFL